VDVAHRTAEKDASAWQKQMELSQLQHDKQMNVAKGNCRALQAERDALTMALSAIAVELVRAFATLTLPSCSSHVGDFVCGGVELSTFRRQGLPT